MSYARFSEGDVYVFCSGDGIECLGCALVGGWQHSRWVAPGDTHHDQILDTLLHLTEHEHAGHSVPDCAYLQLIDELRTGPPA